MIQAYSKLPNVIINYLIIFDHNEDYQSNLFMLFMLSQLINFELVIMYKHVLYKWRWVIQNCHARSWAMSGIKHQRPWPWPHKLGSDVTGPGLALNRRVIVCAPHGQCNVWCYMFHVSTGRYGTLAFCSLHRFEDFALNRFLLTVTDNGWAVDVWPPLSLWRTKIAVSEWSSPFSCDDSKNWTWSWNTDKTPLARVTLTFLGTYDLDIQ